MKFKPAETVKKRWFNIQPRYRVILVIFVTALLLAVALNMSGVSLSKEKYNIIPFNAERAMRDMKFLTGLGPRYAGSAAEDRGAEYIADQLEAAGLANVHIEDYEYLVFEVVTAEVSLVEYGPAGILPIPVNARVTEFEHKVDFVLQGYSGSYDWGSFRDDLEVYDLGNGSDDDAWNGASGKAAVIRHDPNVMGNTQLFFKARDYGLKALILHNVMIHEELNYPPIFKGTGKPEGEDEYPDIPFFMASMDMGNQMLWDGANGSKLRIEFDVIRELRDVKVVIGDVPGRESSPKYVLVGAHHDTVYNGDGAVDNTSGTVTVLEMARNMVDEKPKVTIRFATWGGEELGLYGSFGYIDAHRDDVLKNCIYNENLDMPNIDIKRGVNGWIGTTSNESVEDYREIWRMVRDQDSRFDKYNITVDYSDLRFGSDQAAFVSNGIDASFVGGSGSWEYHTYMDRIDRINPESLELFGMVIASNAYHLAETA